MRPGTIVLALAAVLSTALAGCGWVPLKLGFSPQPHPTTAPESAAPTIAGQPTPQQPPPSALPLAPQPQVNAPVEFGVRTLRLQYALSDRTGLPGVISWEQIDIVDEAGRVCPVQNIFLGKGSTGYWTSISFSFEPDAQRITANLTLSMDNVDYPLRAIMTRLDAARWRIHYGFTPVSP